MEKIASVINMENIPQLKQHKMHAQDKTIAKRFMIRVAMLESMIYTFVQLRLHIILRDPVVSIKKMKVLYFYTTLIRNDLEIDTTHNYSSNVS